MNSRATRGSPLRWASIVISIFTLALTTVASAGFQHAVPKWEFVVPDGVHVLDSWGDGYATGDLDGDGIPDVAFGTRNNMVIAVSGHTGRALWTHRLLADTLPVARNAAADVIDLDGDGLPEVVATLEADPAVIRLLDRTGTELWTTTADYRTVTDLAYGDLDGDGFRDIAVAAGSGIRGGGQVLVLNAFDGSRVWSRYLGTGCPQGMDARDVSGDGIPDIAVEDHRHWLHVLDVAGDRVLWQRDIEGYGRDVVIDDVNHFSAPAEIISGGGYVNCFTSVGSVDWSSLRAGNDITVADVIGDYTLRYQTEIVYTDAIDEMLFVLDGFSGQTIWSRRGVFAHTVGDVSGDGVADIVTGSYNLNDGLAPFFWFVEAYAGNGDWQWLYPLVSLDRESFGLATANLDADRRLEVIVANGTSVTALDVQDRLPRPPVVWPGEFPRLMGD